MLAMALSGYLSTSFDIVWGWFANLMWEVRDPVPTPPLLQARLFQVEVALDAVHDLVPDTAFVA